MIQARPAARAAPARRAGPEKKFAKRGFAGKSDGGERAAPYAGKPDGAKSYGKKPYAGRASLMPASATAVRRAAISAMRPPRFNRDDRPRAMRRDGEKRPFETRDRAGEYRRARIVDGDKRP